MFDNHLKIFFQQVKEYETFFGDFQPLWSKESFV